MASSDALPEKPASKALVTAVVLFYIVAALAMVMANKSVLNVTAAPLFFLLIQLIIAVILSAYLMFCASSRTDLPSTSKYVKVSFLWWA